MKQVKLPLFAVFVVVLGLVILCYGACTTGESTKETIVYVPQDDDTQDGNDDSDDDQVNDDIVDDDIADDDIIDDDILNDDLIDDDIIDDDTADDDIIDDDVIDDDVIDDDSSDDDTSDDDTSDDDTSDDDTGDDDTTNDVWIDSSTGLSWQIYPSVEEVVWEAAKTYCDYLPLAGGGWRLPTVSELRSLIRGCDGSVTGGPCGVTDLCLYLACFNPYCGCDLGGGPNCGCYGPFELPGECDGFWSSSEVTDLGTCAWAVGFNSAIIIYHNMLNPVRARCVR